ncbi:hypothetical protein ACFY94_17935 [Streptomyces griseorubiginosus]|uniref:hypothetical protein n=1 Tax=Streptomyces griseorubiginosus TaxID=67304 RepID=UPI0036E82C69
MRTLSLPLALTARISPVVVLAAAGWVLTSGPAATPAPQKESAPQSAGRPSSDGGASAAATTKRYSAAPAPCGSIGAATIKSLVPGAKTAGKEIPSTDPALRRTCSWNALKGYDYRWLDVSFEITESDAAAAKSYKENVTAKSGGGTVPGVGDAGYSVVNLTTEDKQQTREGVVMIQASNALVTVTYNGSDFESKKAPATDEINKGAIKAAKEAVAALESGQKA